MWAQLASTAIGLWLMAAPSVLGYGGIASTHDRIIGPIVASLALMACWEVLRPLRRLNTALGLWLVLAPWLLGFPTPATLDSILSGAALVGLSLVRGKLSKAYGGGWSALWKAPADADAQSR